jgi:hypothetical protein
MSRNPNVTTDIITNNPDKPWSWFGISFNRHVTWEFVEKNIDKHWNWYYVSQNPNITWEIIKDNPDVPWSWCGVSQNPNITLDVIADNPDKPWDWIHICKNPTIFNIPNKTLRKYFAIKKIWRCWFRAVTDPTYTLCKKRLLDEYTEDKEAIKSTHPSDAPCIPLSQESSSESPLDIQD